jgi:serine/threonine-protein kinase HipA
MTTKAAVFYSNQRAGTLSKHGKKYLFAYEVDYLKSAGVQPVSVSLPLRLEPYEWNVFPPFFDGLLPEGWLLDLTSAKYKIDRGDKFALLLAVGGHTTGAVHVEPLETPDV